MIRLNRKLLEARSYAPHVQVPPLSTLDLPEKVLQFGAGVFLRGFLDDFIQQANSRGDFGGRVVVVQRAPDSRSELAKQQDSLYTLWLRGLQDGELTETRRVIGSISRILAASQDWDEVLKLARDKQLQVILSNTTEVGYATEAGDTLDAAPPPSFPAKLTQVLWHRWQQFQGERAPLVVPCELLENNGGLLRGVVLELAAAWKLDRAFTQWVEQRVTFASTLVDRIVTGPPARDVAEKECQSLGYQDGLLLAAEPFYLLAVEDPDGSVARRFPLSGASPNALFTSDIKPYWTRKLRLLNAPHTLLSPQGLMAGCRTVKQAIDRPELREYLEVTMLDEIVTALGEDERAANTAYAKQVLERFANPFVEHLLENICVNCATKAGVRVFPLARAYYAAKKQVPRHIARGLAAVLLFTRGDWGQVRDPNAAFFAAQWSQHPQPDQFVRCVLANPAAWGGQSLGADIFAPAIAEELREFQA